MSDVSVYECLEDVLTSISRQYENINRTISHFLGYAIDRHVLRTLRTLIRSFSEMELINLESSEDEIASSSEKTETERVEFFSVYHSTSLVDDHKFLLQSSSNRDEFFVE